MQSLQEKVGALAFSRIMFKVTIQLAIVDFMANIYILFRVEYMYINYSFSNVPTIQFLVVVIWGKDNCYIRRCALSFSEKRS